jgi:hypothetical protein
LTVTGIADAGNNTVTVRATIENAAGTGAVKTNFTADMVIQLTYQNTIRTVKVTGITVDTPAVEEGQHLDLTSLVTLNPSGANINGVPITPADITWTIVGTAPTGSSISGSTFTAGTPGTITIQATLPASKNGGTQVTQTVPFIISPAGGHHNITSIGLSSPFQSVRFYTKNTLVGGQKTKVVYDSAGVYLSGNLEFNPPNATVQSPVTWSAVSGNADKVFFRTDTSPQNIYVRRSINFANPGDPALGAGILPTNGEEIKVQATIAKAQFNEDYSDFVSGEFAVSLQEIFVNNVVDLPDDFRLDSTSLEVGQVVDLKGLAHLPAGATRYVNGGLEYITANDLTWQITGGTGATLSGSSLTGTAAGSVTIRATLPADKNQGEALTRTATITITAPPPPPPPPTPTSFTLRFVKVNASDYVSQIALVPTSDAYSTAIQRTGHTKVRWATDTSSHKGAETKKVSEFDKKYPDAVKYTITKIDKENDWADITIPWPAGNVTGYYLFFLEGDGRVRGYVNPGKLDPDWEFNFLFYLRPDYLYDSLRMWMSTYKQASPNSSGSLYVIPIGYDSHDNTASIMKPKGVGQRPDHDLSDY